MDICVHVPGAQAARSSNRSPPKVFPTDNEKQTLVTLPQHFFVGVCISPIVKELFWQSLCTLGKVWTAPKVTCLQPYF